LYSNLLGFNLFAYCYNNPVNYIDPYGESGTAALAGWAASSWWLTFADGVLPIGDIIYVVGCAVLTGVVVAETIFVAEEAATAIAKATDTTPEKAIPFPDPQPNEKGEEETEDIPNVEYPGDDPTVAPEGYEWKGKPGSTPGSKEGNYYNPKTGESLRPDLQHPPEIGPHWDYNYRGSGHRGWRIFPNGRVQLK